MIELREIELRESDDATVKGVVRTLQLVLDGRPIEPGRAIALAMWEKRVRFFVKDPEVWSALCEHRFADLPTDLGEASTRVDLGPVQALVRIRNLAPDAELPLLLARTAYDVAIEPDLDLYRWRAAWTPMAFIEEYRTRMRARVDPGALLRHPGYAPNDGELTVSLPSPKPTDQMSETLSRWLPMIQDVLESTERALEARLGAGSLVMRFDFPPQVQGACEQYLTFFAQFLRDFGVEADTSLRHEGTTALFSVTPQDKGQALDQVWRALSLYLQLPEAPAMSVVATRGQDPRVGRVAAQVQALQGEVRLAQTLLLEADAALRVQALELRARDREIEVLEREGAGQLQTIQAQRALLRQQGQALESANVLIESLRSVQRDGEEVDKEELLDGFVKVGTWEEKGVAINLAMGIRALRKFLPRWRGGDPPAGPDV